METFLTSGFYKKYFILTVIVILSSIEYCISQTFNIRETIDSLETLINHLPRTEIISFYHTSYHDRYRLKFNEFTNQIVVKSFRYKPKSIFRNGEKSKAIIPVSDLHPDGITIRYNEDSTNLGLFFYTANNIRTIVGKSYYQGIYHFGDLSDRLYIGDWNCREYEETIKTIQELLIRIILQKTKWSICDTPNTNGFPIHKKLDSVEVVSKGNYHINNEFFLNNHIDTPALFGNSKTEQENRVFVKKYIADRVDDYNIEQGIGIVGSIIVSKSGKVKDFLPIKCNDAVKFNEIKQLLLRMPKWTPGIYDGMKINVSQVLIL